MMTKYVTRQPQFHNPTHCIFQFKNITIFFNTFISFLEFIIPIAKTMRVLKEHVMSSGESLSNINLNVFMYKHNLRWNKYEKEKLR